MRQGHPGPPFRRAIFLFQLVALFCGPGFSLSWAQPTDPSPSSYTEILQSELERSEQRLKLLTRTESVTDEFAGLWKIDGANSAGVPYTGWVEIIGLGEDRYRVVGSIRHEDGSAAAWVGEGIRDGSALQTKYVSTSGGRGTEKLVFDPATRTISGTWASHTSGKQGQETYVHDPSQEIPLLRKRVSKLRWQLRRTEGGNPLGLPRVNPRGKSRTIKVHFSKDPSATEGLSPLLAKEILATKRKLDIAVFELNLPEVVNALVQAHNKGVTVRVVIDSIHSEEAIATLRSAGIEVVTDDRAAYMHNKFLVIDNRRVVTGSFNPTEAALEDDNNMLILNSPELASTFRTEFEEMFVERLFGPLSPKNTSPGPYRVGKTQVSVYFAPEDNVRGAILDELARAKQKVRFLAFSFTDPQIAALMISSRLQGVDVKGIFEKQFSGKESTKHKTLELAGSDVRWDTNGYAMHNKVIVVDDQTVLVGSFNFSESANQKNDENLVIVRSRAVAAQYLEEFGRLWNRTTKVRTEETATPAAGGAGIVETLEEAAATTEASNTGGGNP